MGLLGRFDKDVKPAEKGKFVELEFKDGEKVKLKVDESNPVKILDNKEVGYLKCRVEDQNHKYVGKAVSIKLPIQPKTEGQQRRLNQFLKAFFKEEQLINDNYDPSELRGRIFTATNKNWEYNGKTGSYWQDFKAEKQSEGDDIPF